MNLMNLNLKNLKNFLKENSLKQNFLKKNLKNFEIGLELELKKIVMKKLMADLVVESEGYSFVTAYQLFFPYDPDFVQEWWLKQQVLLLQT